ncbi:MAG TPA: ATP-grasp domain-containing protein [Bacteroidota bacterium]|nr:ATP-grasp domain-containing protein [Bacteroidota bacterium]
MYNEKVESVSTSDQLPPPSIAHAGQALPADASNPDRSGRINDIFAEWDTHETIHAVRVALEERFLVEMIEANESAFEKLRKLRPMFVFNIAEGLHGVSREAQVPAMLEFLRIPYLGSDPLTLALCLDKARTKEILAYHGIPTAPFTVVTSRGDLHHLHTSSPGYPAIVKPLHEGSSKGIYNSCVVRSAAELQHEIETVLDVYGQPALVEEFLPGREFTVAILGNGADARALPIVEISFDALPDGVNPIYSYEAKWIWDQAENPLEIFECPARIDEALRAEIEHNCLKAYRHLGCRDWSRIDVRLDDAGRPHILEINPLPGILPRPEDNSCFPKAARAAGMTYSQLINAVLDVALRRCHLLMPEPDREKIAN